MNVKGNICTAVTCSGLNQYFRSCTSVQGPFLMPKASMSSQFTQALLAWLIWYGHWFLGYICSIGDRANQGPFGDRFGLVWFVLAPGLFLGSVTDSGWFGSCFAPRLSLCLVIDSDWIGCRFLNIFTVSMTARISDHLVTDPGWFGSLFAPRLLLCSVIDSDWFGMVVAVWAVSKTARISNHFVTDSGWFGWSFASRHLLGSICWSPILSAGFGNSGDWFWRPILGWWPIHIFW